MRGALLAVLVLGMLGTGAELLLLGHTEDRIQWIPLVALGLGLTAVAWVTVSGSRAALLALRGLTGAFVVVGLIGVNRHYVGNVEFARELYPTMTGFDLFQEAMTGATPALAPGTMVLLGLLGLTYCWRHPILNGPR